ncbi:MAG: asparagine synthase-related protein, partial [Sporichthyaceae bacterium]|nr:asparagine synthase-related protein [Sporichthyaceae bacterium]
MTIDGRAPDAGPVDAAVRAFRTGRGAHGLASIMTSGTTVLALESTVVLLPDPIGCGAAFSVVRDGAVVFASRARALASLLGEDVDSGWLATWLLAPAYTTPYLKSSPWRGVHRVHPGAALVIRNGRPIVEQVGDGRRSRPENAATAVNQALRAAVARRLTGSVTADLSGGLDSTTVALLAASMHEHPLTAVTLGTDLAGCDDMEYARRAAASAPTVRHVVLTVPATVDPYSRLDGCPVTDEPFDDLVNHARLSWWFSTIANLGSSAHLSGNGGDAVSLAPLVYLADLLRTGALGALWQHSRGWARLRHQSIPRVLAAVA